MNKLLKVIYDPKHTIQWDKLLAVNEWTPAKPGVKTIGYSYTNNKKQFTIASRDFYEKGFNFYENGKFYRYSCSVPNAELEGPNGEKPAYPTPDQMTVRGDVLINCGMMWRGPDGKIIHN